MRPRKAFHRMSQCYPAITKPTKVSDGAFPKACELFLSRQRCSSKPPKLSWSSPKTGSNPTCHQENETFDGNVDWWNPSLQSDH